MSISSVASGLSSNQPALKSPVPARANTSNTQPVAVGQAQVGTAGNHDEIDETSAVVRLGETVSHSAKVGVAAYIAIMNPQNATSMRTEA